MGPKLNTMLDHVVTRLYFCRRSTSRYDQLNSNSMNECIVSRGAAIPLHFSKQPVGSPVLKQSNAIPVRAHNHLELGPVNNR